MKIVTVVDFLYRGKANIIQENLDSFFAVAQELQGWWDKQMGKKSGVRSRQHSIEAKQFQSSHT